MSEALQFNLNFKDLSPESIQRDLEAIKKQQTYTLDEIANLKDKRTFSNTVQPLIITDTLIGPTFGGFGIASNFHPQKEVRDAGVAAEEDVSKFFIDCQQRKDVYNALKDYSTTNYPLEKASLSPEEVRYFEHTMRDFRREGLHLEDPELVQMKKQLSVLTTQYRKNLNEEKTEFEYTRYQLDGMPPTWFTKEKLLKDHEDPQQEVYKLTLQYPDYLPGMKYIKDESVRHTVYGAYQSRCAKENTPLFEEAVQLRHHIATKLGYPTHADYKTEVKIVKNAETANTFLTNMNKMITPQFQKENQEVLEFAQAYKENPLTKTKFDSWDRAYYNRLYTEKICDLDLDEVKQYFPLDTVRKGLFNIYQRLLGLKFTEVDTDNKWHKDAQLFRVNDAKTTDLMGYFYLDMHPREGKYGHAAVFDIINGCDMSKITGQKDRRPYVVAMACNFPPNECISFSDVETFFHEFGHVMHQICSKTQLSEFCGFGTENDFVEAPSQMLEFWCYCEAPLRMMSSHKTTGKPIPVETINKLKAMKRVLAAYQNKRQLTFSLFDLRAHMTACDTNTPFNSQEFWYNNVKEVTGEDTDEMFSPAASFGHLMGGYDAGYYGYLRSNTYAANMFYKWFKDGKTLDPESGMRYRKLLLEPGSTKDGIDLITDFLGSPPEDKYFLIDRGLLVEDK